MLEELRIQNFAIIDELLITFAEGFNVITGETGAGKSILIDAVELLMGGKADSAYVRADAKRAVIEGTFILDEMTRGRVLPILLEQELAAPLDPLKHIILSRELRASGRSSSRINGLTCSADVLREVGEALLDIHGQSAHLSLFKPRNHLDLLDRYADLLEVRSAIAQVVENLGTIRREMQTLEADQDALERRAELLRYEVDDIDAADLEDEGEEETLLEDLKRLSSSEQLANLSTKILALLGDEDGDEVAPAVDALMQVSRLMQKLIQLDSRLADDAALAEEISTNAQELAINIAGYADEIEHDPGQLEVFEERLDLIKRLKRRYNADTITDLMAYADRARDELESIEHSDERLEVLRQQEEKTLRHIGELSERMRKVREVAGRALAKRVVRELKDLRMERTQFEVLIERREDPDGAYGRDGVRYAFDSTGMDRLEFMMSANPGEPLRPLSKVASGGEAARIMLALKRVLSQADQTPTLIFDEIDQGIGGRIGAVVGEKLWSLSDNHQVLVVTHLPQLAGFGDRHFHVSKAQDDRHTQSNVNVLDNEVARVSELADMLGGIGESGVQSASDILHAADDRKAKLRPKQAIEQEKLL